MLPYGKKPKTLPVVLSVEEVAQLLAAARPGRERMLLTTAYACGLRISELLHLAGDGHRQRADGGDGAAGQGSEGSAGAAVAAVVDGVAAVVEPHRTKPWLFPGMTEQTRARPMHATSVQRM